MQRLLLVLSAIMLLSMPVFAATPFGGDDTGFLAPDGSKGPIGKCEAAVSKAVAKVATCIFKCHDKRAVGKLADDTAEDACEKANDGKSCLAKYFTEVTKALSKGHCPACLVSGANGVGMLAESLLDANNGQVYCASPSGAFVE
jgi:hypothetical protein